MLISVLVCSYNSRDILEAALNSALYQKLAQDDFEVLLVDDGSTDGTSSLAHEIAEKHANFRYLPLPVNQGLVAACNYGLNCAHGKYFIRLDADDSFHNEILCSLVGALEQDETDLVYTDRYDVNLADGPRRLVKVEPFQLFELIATGPTFRTQLVRQLGGYRALVWEEYDLYLRYLSLSTRRPVRIPRPLYHYSIHESSMTADPEKVRKGWDELKQLWGETVLKKFGWPGEIVGSTS